MGWMTQVASIPDAPPLINGLTVGHTPPISFGFSSPILIRFDENQKKGREKGDRISERDSDGEQMSNSGTTLVFIPSINPPLTCEL